VRAEDTDKKQYLPSTRCLEDPDKGAFAHWGRASNEHQMQIKAKDISF
jgi:hypothetical protein